jgi:hypothetical protein
LHFAFSILHWLGKVPIPAAAQLRLRDERSYEWSLSRCGRLFL